MRHKPLVAVVNDDTQFLRMMDLILEDAGYDTVIFFESDSAFDQIRQQLPDLVVLDIRMEKPESGWLILDLMRLDKQTAGIPVVVCSADHEQLASKEEHLRSKRAEVLLKPFDIEDLLAIVGRFVPPTESEKVSSAAG